jgi:hypothetical protein
VPAYPSVLSGTLINTDIQEKSDFFDEYVKKV